MSPEILMMHLVVWLNQYDVDRESKGLEPPHSLNAATDNGRLNLSYVSTLKSPIHLKSEMGVWKQGDVRHDCVSDFALAAIESELPPLSLLFLPRAP